MLLKTLPTLRIQFRRTMQGDILLERHFSVTVSVNLGSIMGVIGLLEILKRYLSNRGAGQIELKLV